VYIFTRSGTTWTQQTKLTSPYNVADDSFGGSISLYGDTVVIGAINPCEAYVFTRDGTTWTQQATLSATDGQAGDAFGCSVSLYGDSVIVGAVNANAAYIFTRDGTTWTRQTRLFTIDSNADSVFGNTFGCAVSLYKDTAVIGDNTAGLGAGAAYIFTRSDTTWTQQAKLTQLYGIDKNDLSADDLAGYTNSLFGGTVSLNGNAVVISGSAEKGGEAYVFIRNGTTWNRQAKLMGPDVREGDLFGVDVSIYGNKVVIGYPGYSTLHFASITGAAYVYDVSNKK
jgi:hypothetical protein